MIPPAPKLKILITGLCLLTAIILATGCRDKEASSPTEAQALATPDEYEEDWASLGKYKEDPEWFRKAKFGIYFHWGLYSVPAFQDEWYPRWMHFKGNKVYEHHKATYGEPSVFGYHDFAPMFKAEKFDPESWAELFEKAGARFAGPVAEHHDGYSMWDSDITPWNTMNTGPHRDITGELSRAIRGHGMKLITAFHHAKNLQRSTELGKENPLSHYPYFADMPPSSDDPDLQLMYGNIEPEKWYREVWLGKLKEVIDKYQPDIMWFDYVLGNIPEAYRKEYAAYYLNQAAKSGQEVVVVRKQNDLPLSMSVEDLEQSRKNAIGTRTWMTDATISDGSWCYTENLQVKKAEDVLHILIDIVSKNGVLLLNISPKADGTIPENQQQGLLKIGNWLHKYGEAIYDTEAWYTFGEGPTKEPEGHFGNHEAFMKLKYSNKDIRYTTKDYSIYAIVLGELSPNQEILLTAFAKKNILDTPSIESVSFQGNIENIAWEYIEEEGLKLKAPEKALEEMATVIKITVTQ